MRDLKSNVSVIEAINAQDVGTTGTGRTSAAIDLAGYNSALVVANYGAITATGAVFTLEVTEGDTTGGTFTAVADADLVGTEAAAGLAAATRVDGSTENVSKSIGYVGNKRYIKVQISSTATAGTPVSASVVRGHLRHAS